jgi:hypothetical protein
MIGIAQMKAGPPIASVAPVISSAPVVGPWKATANSDPVRKPSARLNRGSTPSWRRYSLSLTSVAGVTLTEGWSVTSASIRQAKLCLGRIVRAQFESRNNQPSVLRDLRSFLSF